MIDAITSRLQQQNKQGNSLKTINFIASNASAKHDATKALKIGAGLENLGNTCFMNSVLQLLNHQKDFRVAIESSKHTCPKKNKFCVVCVTKRHLKRGMEAKVFAPKEFAGNLKQIGKQFKLGRQEDSHEFLRCLVDKLNDAIKPSKSIEGVFGGSLASQVTCLHCKNVSSVQDPIMDISLDIKNCNSIEQAFHRFTAPELLNKGNQYKCEKCRKLRDAHKRIVIGKAPRVLAIQLKRFNSFYRNATKVTRAVKFQETLNLTPFQSSAIEGSSMYSLVGVLVHSGHSCNSGHYYSYVKPSKGSAWYRMNDEEVSRVGAEHVLSQSAYLLIYEKQDESLTSKVQKEPPSKVAVERKKWVVPLNATFMWEVVDAIPLGDFALSELNSTINFQVKAERSPIEIDKESPKSASLPSDISQKTVESKVESPAPQVVGKIVRPSVSEQPAPPNAHFLPPRSVQQTNFLEELQRQAPVVQTWSHVATSDKVFERRAYLEQQQREDRMKRKRASKDDMEYDAPKRKGFKKNKERRF